jgi:hypothetical protein
VVLDDDVLLHAVPDEAVASHGDLVRPERTRGRAPSIVSIQRERKRVSSAKRPITGAVMSPRSSDAQNVEPSRIVKATRS